MPRRYASALLFGGGPALLLAALGMAGVVSAALALFCALLCLAWGFGAGILVLRDAEAGADAIRAARGESAELPDRIRLRLPGMGRLNRELLLLLRAERRRRAGAAEGVASSHVLLERLPDALFLLGGAPGARRVIWRNPAAAVFGAEESALLRHPVLRAAIASAEGTAMPARASLSLPAPVPRDLDASVIKAGAAKDSAPLYLLIADRTRERGLDRMRADFVANASHELRTPLTSLIGFIETLRGPAADDPEAARRFLAIMAEQAGRMQLLISDLLNLSRIEMAEHQPPEEVIDLPPLLSRVADGMEPMLRAAPAVLERRIAPDLPHVAGDAGQLQQIFTNLLDNAIKYGRPGGRIILAASAVSGDPRFPSPGILVAIADDGPGIPREHLPRLTERFYRVDKARSRAVGGTGLGLAIVKHVINRHRGRLVIESAEGRGTTCSVWLPLARNAAPPLQGP